MTNAFLLDLKFYNTCTNLRKLLNSNNSPTPFFRQPEKLFTLQHSSTPKQAHTHLHPPLAGGLERRPRPGLLRGGCQQVGHPLPRLPGEAPRPLPPRRLPLPETKEAPDQAQLRLLRPADEVRGGAEGREERRHGVQRDGEDGDTLGVRL